MKKTLLYTTTFLASYPVSAQPNLQDTASSTEGMSLLLFTIVFAGIFGGIVNFFQLYSDEYRGKMNFWKCVIVGVGAAFLVPLFLQMISSNLVETSQRSVNDLMVFVGFCLIASIFSRRFIETIGDKILKQVEEAKQKAEVAKGIAEENKEEINVILSNTTEVDDVEAASSTHSSATVNNMESDTFKITDKGAIRVLNALRNQRYTFRTLRGITKDSDLDDLSAIKTLEKLFKDGLITKREKNGRYLYALTENGHRVNLPE